MNKSLNKNNLSKILDIMISENQELANSIERKGKYKYLLLLNLLTDILKEKNVASNDLLEVYKFFIRLRRFIFKWINQIEDYMTSFLENNNKINLQKLYIDMTMNQKFKKYFKEKDFYLNFFKKHKFFNIFKDYDDFLKRVDFLVKTRNWVCHTDLIYLNFIKENSGFYSIKDCIDNIKYFIWEKCKNGDIDNKWKSYDHQIRDILWNPKDKKVSEKQVEIFNKIIEFNFENIDIFNY